MLVAANGPNSWVWWEWVRTHGDTIATATREHLVLTFYAVGIGLLISLPLGLLAWRWRWLAGPVFGLTGSLYTIPSLALFALLIPITGLGRTTAEIGLVSYTLLILIRNIVTGLDSVPDDVREAARGMGFTPRRQLVRIEIPLAVPAIVAGVRIATVTTIGLVTVTALIGQGGYGQLIIDGLQREFHTPLVVGTVLSVLMATVIDVVLIGVEKLITPWSRRRVRVV